jgi:hypothetical protein
MLCHIKNLIHSGATQAQNIKTLLHQS